MNNPSHPQILIVEDSVDIQLLLSQILKSEGYEVVIVSNGIEALEHLNSRDRLPNLILLDLMMPDMDGHEFRKRQKDLARGNVIPVVVMSADEENKNRVEDLEISDYLSKPFTDIDTILATVKKHLL